MMVQQANENRSSALTNSQCYGSDASQVPVGHRKRPHRSNSNEQSPSPNSGKAANSNGTSDPRLHSNNLAPLTSTAGSEVEYNSSQYDTKYSARLQQSRSCNDASSVASSLLPNGANHNSASSFDVRPCDKEPDSVKAAPGSETVADSSNSALNRSVSLPESEFFTSPSRSATEDWAFISNCNTRYEQWKKKNCGRTPQPPRGKFSASIIDIFILIMVSALYKL